MKDYKFNVDVRVCSDNCVVDTSFGFDSVSKALKCFNDSIETQRRSHVLGQQWYVTLFAMDPCEVLGSISFFDFGLE